MYAVAVGAGHVIAIGENKIQGASDTSTKKVKASEESKSHTEVSREANREEVPNVFSANRDEAPGKDDLVDQISEAAQKLMSDPNSYYYHLKKDEKANVDEMMESDDNKAGEFSGSGGAINITNQASQASQAKRAPIEPYPRSSNPTIKKSSISRTKSPNESPDLRNHNIANANLAEKSVPQELEKYENVAEKRQKLFDAKPPMKKKKVDPPQVKLPPAPRYVPLPCLECKNIGSVCEALGISKIEEAVKLVNDIRQGTCSIISRKPPEQPPRRKLQTPARSQELETQDGRPRVRVDAREPEVEARKQRLDQQQREAEEDLL